MMIREYKKKDFDEILRLRNLLYFDHDKNTLCGELCALFQGNPYYDAWTMFVYERAQGGLGAILEIGLVQAIEYKDRVAHFAGTKYHEQMNNLMLENKPIPLVESWYVDEDIRGKHIGENLMMRAEQWVKARGYACILSDTDDFRENAQKVYKCLHFDNYYIDHDGCHYYYKEI